MAVISAPAALPTSTRAIVLTRDAAGQYSWRLGKAPVPAVGDHEVLLRIHAVSIQRADLETLHIMNDSASTDMFNMGHDDHSGRIVGADAAGEVLAVGGLVKSVRRGDRVVTLYFPDFVDGPLTKEKQEQGRYYLNGVFADYVVIEETGLAPVPPGLTYEEASTLPLAGVTAWVGTLGAIGGPLVRPGDTVIVQGTGGLSTFALQFVTAAGANAIVTSHSDEKLEEARKLGAKGGINYKQTPNWAERVRELTNGRGADVVIDMGGKGTAAQSVECLKYYGTLILLGAVSGFDETIPAVPVLNKIIRVQGVYTGSRADYMRMSEFMTVHHIKPVIARTYPLEKYPEAVKELQTGNYSGKLVMTLD
jgi:NADPH:quinone reductase-like Zn-dependent oxidoreductase